MLFVLGAVTAGGFLLLGCRGTSRAVAFLILPLVLLCSLGMRIEILGLALGLFLLSLDVPRRGMAPWAQGGSAALIAAACGFRVQFLTQPGGGYLSLTWLSIPLTALWVLLLLRSREGLRQSVPRPAVQHGVDLILVLNAIFLALVSPQTRLDPLALRLPFALLGLVLVSAVATARGEETLSVHRAVVFGLALFAIGGVMKGPLSVALLVPLFLTSLPVMTTSQALVAQATLGRPLPQWFVARGYTQGAAAITVLVLASGLALGAVLGIYVSPAHGVLAAGVVPFVIVAHALRPRAEAWLRTGWARASAGRVFLFGLRFHSLTLSEALARVEGFLASTGESHTVVTPNSVSFLVSLKDEGLREAYHRADLVTPDGIGIVWASRLLGAPLKERVSGIDLAEALLERARVTGHRVFLLGGRDEVAARAAQRLEERLPGLVIVGTHHGYLRDDEEPIPAIRAARPEILLVGMGVPRQELWMERMRDRLGIPLLIGVGGTLNVWSGDCRRAPRGWQRLGLEWLYRLLTEPRRIHAALAIPRFMAKILVARVVIDLAAFARLPGRT